MSGRISVCSICPRENEQIDAVIRLSKDRRSCIYGTVIDENGAAVADAVVKLLQVTGCGQKTPVPLTHTFTDKYGQFLLGPLCPGKRYMLKVYKDNVSIRYAPLDVDCYEGSCIGVNGTSDDSEDNSSGCGSNHSHHCR
ncbi:MULTISPECIES: carboxypeptidase-like regulatory domain-containing protein [Clostridium]|uniref:Carboxypeptidase-like regulatory domain-containing protein n=1 Tax=Clostridium aquiflavi TaxID=3073603 RepID=A0ABU1EHA4_9CLOT|nr:MULTISPECIES: carboxypeptidase-like regulatory domain-containing protein [unclassified Clostridium]MDR5587752.1 carboxypeptidase-like regulatory domain-containing protein [Clostridium sp. 5N-1]NFG62416.1 carboxypeptidase regulatory-like domain-containing protein [Clostridium botulinum]NFQ09066.1 carboxypeptidase regulatory-like domain-containing protein [Clostridium botulinum]